MSDQKLPTKIAIVGTAPSSKLLAPFHDPSWQIWACSGGNVDQLPKVDVWYEMHAINEMMAPENRAHAEPLFKWLREKSDAGMFHVIMLERNELVPKAMPYPRDEMIALFGRNWFTSSVAYMMAMAIARGADEIGLFGVDMAAGMEHYSAQRAGCTRFIEIAMERGIKVQAPDESCILASVPMYGYWEGTPFGRRINASVVHATAARNAAAAEIARLTGIRDYHDGALEQLHYFQRTWTDGADLQLNPATEAFLAEMAAHKAAAEAPPLASSPPLAPVLAGEVLVPVDQLEPAPAPPPAPRVLPAGRAPSLEELGLGDMPAPNGAIYEPEPLG